MRCITTSIGVVVAEGSGTPLAAAAVTVPRATLSFSYNFGQPPQSNRRVVTDESPSGGDERAVACVRMTATQEINQERRST
jgi:hypothetical protein